MSTITGALKRNLIAGLLLILPAGIPAWFVYYLWNLIEAPLQRLSVLASQPAETLGDTWIERLVFWCQEQQIDLAALARIPGLSLFIMISLIYLIGMVARSLIGQGLISLGESIVHRLPIVGTLYSALKQIIEAILSDQTKAFREAVLIEYPRQGLYSVGFITRHIPPAENSCEEQLVCFVPTTPNPTSGVLVIVNASAAIPLDLSTDEALKFVISGGIVLPPERIQAGLDHFWHKTNNISDTPNLPSEK